MYHLSFLKIAAKNMGSRINCLFYFKYVTKSIGKLKSTGTTKNNVVSHTAWNSSYSVNTKAVKFRLIFSSLFDNDYLLLFLVLCFTLYSLATRKKSNCAIFYESLSSIILTASFYITVLKSLERSW